MLGEVAPFNLRFPDASDKQWREFIRTLATQEIEEVSANGKMGTFGIGARRMKDLELMTDVKLQEFQDEDGESINMYMGKFILPLTLERFLQSPKIQYNVFKTSIAEYRDSIIKNKMRDLIGKNVGGEILTMSGLIGLTSQAGIKGAKSWIARPEERERFPHTTQTFLETNGIF